MVPTTGVGPLMYHRKLLTPWRLRDLAPVDVWLWLFACLWAAPDVTTFLAEWILERAFGAFCHYTGTTEDQALPALIDDAISQAFFLDETRGRRLTLLDRRKVATVLMPTHGRAAHLRAG